jgi:hypothetical protein
MNFNDWLAIKENLELKSTRTPNLSEPIAKIYRFKLTDKQSVDSWKRDNTYKTYSFPLAKEKFIHFAPVSIVPAVLKEKVLRGNNGGVFAISTSFGQYLPQVQYRSSGKGMAGNPKARPAKYNEELSAIIFETDELPIQAGPFEVAWDGNYIQIKNSREIGKRLAITILKNTRYGKFLTYNDSVEYQ